MYFNFCIIIITILCISCELSPSGNKKLKINSIDSVGFEKGSKQIKDTSGFFSNCHELIDHVSSGYLQGLSKEKDSIGFFCFYECFDCNETFEIIFVYQDVFERKKVSHDFIWNELKNGCKDYFRDFSCYAFVAPMRDPDKQQDIHAMNMDFPLEVKVYKRISNDTWRFLNSKKIETFEQYSLVRFNTIYQISL